MTKKNQSSETLTRDQIIQSVAQAINIDNGQAKLLVNHILLLMSDAIVNEKELKLHNFGSFKVHHKKQHVGRNFHTREAAIVKPRQIIRFKPGLTLKDKMS